jgi:NADH-quinone oxidoreductase subunit D
MIDPVDGDESRRQELPLEIMELQMGPSHPATHGTIKFNLKLEGERVLDCDVEVGFLHRGFDKSCEQATWTQVIPYTDRLNYASSLINNVGYALAVEKLIGAETPPRCQYIRVIISELARIYDHLTCCGMAASEMGAITAGFYMIEAREMITRIVENLTGARLTVTYVRIGGVKHDLPQDFAERVKQMFKTIRKLLDDCDRLLSRNRIFIDRMSNIGTISQEFALNYSLTGPMLRATGSTTMCARFSRIWFTISSTSTCRSVARGTTTTVSSAGSRRSRRACASSSKHWRDFPWGRCGSTIRTSFCRRRRRSITASKA